MKYSEFIKLVLKAYRISPNYLCVLAERMGDRLGKKSYATRLKAEIILEIILGAEKAGRRLRTTAQCVVDDMFDTAGTYHGPNKPLYDICLASSGSGLKAARITLLLHLYKLELKQELHHV